MKIVNSVELAPHAEPLLITEMPLGSMAVINGAVDYPGKQYFGTIVYRVLEDTWIDMSQMGAQRCWRGSPNFVVTPLPAGSVIKIVIED